MENDNGYTVDGNRYSQSQHRRSIPDQDEPSTGSINTSTEATPLLYPVNSIEESHSSISDRKGTLFSSIFTLVSTMIGGGLLSLPFAFEQGGFGVASVVLLLVLFASTYGGFLIINSKKYCDGRVKNIEDVARVAFGTFGERIVQLVLIAILYLASVAYFILIFDQVSPLIEFALGKQGTVWSSRLVVLAFVSAVVFPISLLKNLSALRFTSGLSVLCGLLLCICVGYRSIENDIGGPLKKPDNPVKYYTTSIRELLTCVSIAELTFSCHFNILPMHSELRHQTRRNKRIILCSAMGICYVLNFIVSFFGYMQFRKFTDQDITKDYKHDDVVIAIGRGALGLVLILSYPLLIVPCRQTLNKMFWSPGSVVRWRALGSNKLVSLLSNDEMSGPSGVIWVFETLFLVGTGFVLAYVVPQVNMIWGFVGSIGCTIIIYILPPAFYLKVRSHPDKPDAKQVGAVILLIVGFFLLIAGLYQSIMNIISPIPERSPFAYINSNQSNSAVNYSMW